MSGGAGAQDQRSPPEALNLPVQHATHLCQTSRSPPSTAPCCRAAPCSAACKPAGMSCAAHLHAGFSACSPAGGTGYSPALHLVGRAAWASPPGVATAKGGGRRKFLRAGLQRAPSSELCGLCNQRFAQFPAIYHSLNGAGILDAEARRRCRVVPPTHNSVSTEGG